MPRSAAQQSLADMFSDPAMLTLVLFTMEYKLLQYRADIDITLVEQVMEAQRQPDSTRQVLGKDITVRTFSWTLAEGETATTGTLVLDEQGGLVELQTRGRSSERVE